MILPDNNDRHKTSRGWGLIYDIEFYKIIFGLPQSVNNVFNNFQRGIPEIDTPLEYFYYSCLWQTRFILDEISDNFVKLCYIAPLLRCLQLDEPTCVQLIV